MSASVFLEGLAFASVPAHGPCPVRQGPEWNEVEGGEFAVCVGCDMYLLLPSDCFSASGYGWIRAPQAL